MKSDLPMFRRALEAAHIDSRQKHRQPSATAVIVSSCASLAGSLLADVVLVVVGTSIFPSTKGYGHFRFSDYGELTTIGVVIACVGWVVVTRISSEPRWLFFRCAVLVTCALWIPDIWLLTRNQPAKAVVVLMVMHLAIALVTYNCLVRIASVDAEKRPHGNIDEMVSNSLESCVNDVGGDLQERAHRGSVGNRYWIAMSSFVGLEFMFGVAALLFVPVGRPSGWVPVQGRTLYLVHGCLGALLFLGAVVLFVLTMHADRISRIASVSGLIGIAFGAAGGALGSYHSARLAGMGLMLLGALIAGFGYLVPVMEQAPSNSST